MNAATIPCPFCGAPVTGGVCPYCQARVGQGPLALQPREASQLTSGADGAALAFDPALGFLLVGAHAPQGEPPRIRAWDMAGRRVVWEALQGQGWVAEATVRSRGRSVYVAHKRQLLALDLASGARKWGLPLPDAIEAVSDPFPPVGRGAILVRTIDNGLHALDRDSGQVLWARSFGDKRFDIEAIPESGACLVRYGFPYVKVDVVNPGYAQPVASLGHDHWSTDLGLARPHGRTVVTVCDDLGRDGDDDGLLAFDAVTGAVHAVDKVDDLDEDVVGIGIGPRTFAAADEGLYVGPRGRVVPPPIPGHKVVAFAAAGPTLAVLLQKAHGTPIRRVVGMDPATLGFRFDCGEVGTEPEGRWEGQLATDGYSLVFVGSARDDRSACELRSVDTTSGRTLWTRAVGTWRAHRFVGGHLVVWSDQRVEVLTPANGQVVAAYG